MASPVVQAVAESAVTTASTSQVVTLPTGIAAGDLVIIFAGHAVAVTYNALTGWTELVDTNTANAEKILYRWCDGTEGTSVTFTASAATKAAFLAWRISGAINPATQAPELSTVATGTSTTPNATAVTPTGGAKDYLWFTTFVTAGEEADDDTWGGAAPSPFTNALYVTSGIAGQPSTNCSVAGAQLASNASTMDPGAWGANAQSLAWRAWTIAVHPTNITTYTRTHSADAVILKNATRAHSADAVVLKGATRTHGTDAVVLKNATGTHSVTAVVQKTLSPSHAADVVVLKNATPSHSTDAIVVKTITHTHSVDAVISAGGSTVTKTHTTDSRVKAWEPPFNLVATAISSSAIDLSFEEIPTATEYDIERDSVVIQRGWTGTPSGGRLTFHDTGLSPSTNYVYRVRAVR